MPGLEELKGLVRTLKSGVHFHMSNLPLIDWAVQTIERHEKDLEAYQQVIDRLKHVCDQLEDAREYNADLVADRDTEIQKLREQVATLADPARLAQALSAFTVRQSELALTEKDGTC